MTAECCQAFTAAGTFFQKPSGLCTVMFFGSMSARQAESCSEKTSNGIVPGGTCCGIGDQPRRSDQPQPEQEVGLTPKSPNGLNAPKDIFAA